LKDLHSNILEPTEKAGGSKWKLPQLLVRFTAMYDRNFKPKVFTDITMPVKLFVAQILARYMKFKDITFYNHFYVITIYMINRTYNHWLWL